MEQATADVLGIVVAAGRGTRWQASTDAFTGGKHLASIDGAPLIQYAVREVFDLGATRVVVIATPRTAELYRSLLRPDEWGAVEVMVQGRSGGVAQAMALASRGRSLPEALVIRLGDNYFPTGSLPLTQAHAMFPRIANGEALGLLVVHRSAEPHKHAVVTLDADGEVSAIQEKPTAPRSDLVVAGVYVLPRSSLLRAFSSLSPSPRGEYETGELLEAMRAGGVRFSLHQLDKDTPRASVDTRTQAEAADRVERTAPRGHRMRTSGKPAIYLTGLAGFLGSRLARALVAEGYPVAGVDDLSTGALNNLPSGFRSDDCLTADITRKGSITKMAAHLREHRRRGDGRLYVVHTACPAYDANSFWLIGHVTNGVMTGTANTLAASVRAGIDRFINLSSMARYEIINTDLGKSRVGYEEDDPLGGMTPYGEAKVAAERIVRMTCDRYGIPWTTLVFHNVIGAGQQYDNPIRNVASVMLNLALHGKPPVIYGTGEQVRAYSPWEDIESSVLELVLDHARRFDGLTLNVGPGPQVGMSLIELATLCYSTARRLTGRVITPETHPFQHVELGRSVASMHTAVCSDRRYRMLFGRVPEPDYEHVLHQMGTAMLERPLDFDYSFVRKADLGPKGCPAFLRKHRLTIK